MHRQNHPLLPRSHHAQGNDSRNQSNHAQGNHSRNQSNHAKGTDSSRYKGTIIFMYYKVKLTLLRCGLCRPYQAVSRCSNPGNPTRCASSRKTSGTQGLCIMGGCTTDHGKSVRTNACRIRNATSSLIGRRADIAKRTMFANTGAQPTVN